ncbi:MAG: hypothetical protein AB1779_10055 [Candidatus Thermoplasmatota archaeon]
MMPREHIEEIKNRYLKSDKEFVLASLNRGVDRIEKAFPRYGSFLIKNADVKKGKNTEVVDCLDFNHYQEIVTDRNNWPNAFSKIFKTKETFLARLTILKDVRHPVAHSRRKIEQKDKTDVISSITYFKGIFNQKKLKR